jgi:hypothetical protein
MERRTYGWRTWGDFARELLIGAAIGLVILIVEESTSDRFPDIRGFLRNSILGAMCVLGSRGLETALSWAIEQSRVPTLFRTVIYAVGGWLGYFMGAVGAGALFGYERRDFDVAGFHFFYALALTASVSILVGMILHHNRKRSDRLRASIERLKEHEFAEKELEIARAMQQRLLPPGDIERDGYHISARTQAAHIVGGDFYDVIRLNDGAIAVLAADVSGKGIAASLLMASCKAAVPFLAASGGAAEVMTALNATLFEQLERREFVAMVFCRYAPATGEIEIVNAGMPDPLLIGNSTIRTISSSGERLPLGAMRLTRYESMSLTLQPGERLLMFSDGLPEAAMGDTPIGYERVEELVRQSPDLDALLALVRRENLRIDDDLTLVMLHRR